MAQYIGETCRFLLNVAKSSNEIDPAGPHCIRAMAGNGLRSTIWKTFQETFKIPQICEIYGATEGNSNMGNVYIIIIIIMNLYKIFINYSEIHFLFKNYIFSVNNTSKAGAVGYVPRFLSLISPIQTIK